MKRKGSFGPTIKILAILPVLILGILPLGLASAQEATTVSVSAPGQANPGEQFTIDIVVEPGTAIAGVQFNLAFDPSLVIAVSVAEGNLLSQGGAATYFNPGAIDNTAGTIIGVAGAITTPGQTISTSGTFATVRLTAGTQVGTCPLTLSAVIVGDINGQSVPVSLVGGDIGVTAGTRPAGGGGGTATPDKTPPRISNILVTDITKTSAVVYWATKERSTSQVEYWASPSKLSLLDETPVIEHEVYLTNLTPCTTYSFRVMSRDKAGNLEISEEHTFTTLGTPAAFVISELRITPAEVHIGEEVSISILVTNSGDVAGDYEVTFRLDDTVLATKTIVDLAGGDSEEVTLITTCDVAGAFVIDVNGVTSSLVVKETPLAREDAPPARIDFFNITPSYDTETHKLAYARVFYQVDNPSTPIINAELILIVYLEGKPLEEVFLIATSTLATGITEASHDYIPAQGWESGTYTFQAELYQGGKFCQSTALERLEVSAESAVSAVSVVSWNILGAIIIGMLLISFVVAFFLVRRRRYIQQRTKL